MEIDATSLGRVLQRARKRTGLSAKEVSEATGIPYYTIGRYERGESRDLPFVQLVQLGSLYDLAPNDIAEILGIYHSVETLHETADPRVSRMFQELQKFCVEFDEEQQRMLADTVIALVQVRRIQLQHPGVNANGTEDFAEDDLELPEHIRRKIWN